MITQRDIDLLEKTLVTKDDLNTKLTNLKSDLIDKLDSILKEILASWEEETIFSHKVADREERITKLESTQVN